MGWSSRPLVRRARQPRDGGAGSYREARDLHGDGTDLDIGPPRPSALSGAPGRCRTARARRNRAHSLGLGPLMECLRVELPGPLNPFGVATVLRMAQNRAIAHKKGDGAGI